jgi:hypothetical protein
MTLPFYQAAFFAAFDCKLAGRLEKPVRNEPIVLSIFEANLSKI